MSKKRAYNLQLWRGLIQEQQASGKTIKAWCEEHGYTKDKYYYWLEQVREETFDEAFENLPAPASSGEVAVSAASSKAESESGGIFVELRVPSAPAMCKADSIPAAVIHMESIQIDVFRDTPEEVLRLLLSVLKDA